MYSAEVKRGASKVCVHTRMNRLTSRERSVRNGIPKTPRVHRPSVSFSSSAAFWLTCLTLLLHDSRITAVTGAGDAIICAALGFPRITLLGSSVNRPSPIAPGFARCHYGGGQKIARRGFFLGGG